MQTHAYKVTVDSIYIYTHDILKYKMTYYIPT